MKKQYDVVIIGAGVVGSAIARELSRYKLSIAVLEKNLDVCNETSGRNSAVVHGGFANPTGSLKAKCCVEGNKIMDQLAEELNFPFKRCGKVLVGNTPEDMEQLERTMKQGAVNGCTGLEMIDEAKLHELVPAERLSTCLRKASSSASFWDSRLSCSRIFFSSSVTFSPGMAVSSKERST